MKREKKNVTIIVLDFDFISQIKVKIDSPYFTCPEKPRETT
jgi:hypothetical protein